MGVTQLRWTGLIWATSDEVDKRGFQIEQNIARSRAFIRQHHNLLRYDLNAFIVGERILILQSEISIN